MDGYEVHHSHDAEAVLARTSAHLAGDPVAHNVVLTILHERAAHPEPGTYWWVTEGDHVAGVALQSGPGSAASITPMTADAADALVPVMARTAPGLPGVLGDAATAARFAGRWSEVTGSGAAPREGQRLYRLGSLQVPSGVDGGPRPATPHDRGLVLSWWRGLAADTGEAPPGAEGDASVTRRIDQGEIWMWTVDDRPVSMARLSRPAAGAVRVGFVYTPPERRRRGYAAASVAALSAHGLSQGARECLLYTQLSNPTSNRIYRRIGYEAVGEILAYRFDPGESSRQPR